MTAFSRIALSPAGVAINTAAMLLLFFQLYLLVLAMRQRSGGAIAFCAVRVILGMAATTLLLDGIYALEYLPFAREWLHAVRAVSDAPWIAIVALEAASAAISGVFLAYSLRSARSHPSAYSIKEATDLMPVGICFAEADGTAALANLKMNEISHALTGAAPSDVNALMETARREGESEDGRLIVKCAQSVYVFEEYGVEIGGRSYAGIVAEDQTTQYRAVEEVEKKNAQLRDLQIRLKAFRVREEDLLMKQEILEARTTIHTQLGGALLTGSYYFEHPENADAGELLSLMRQINTYLLAEVEAPEDRRDELAEALKMAKRIGVEVAIDGEVPDDASLRSLLGRAVAECAANTVKHASGDRVDVGISRDGERFVITLTNNGRAPAAPVAESGGLASLRRFAEGMGAVMDVQSAPAFRLTITAQARSDGDAPIYPRSGG